MKEKIFFNGRIFGGGLTDDSILIMNDSIRTVGTFQECRTSCREEPKLIDCRGAWIIPSFTDSHSHLVEMGEALLKPESAAENIDDLLAVFHDQAKENHSGLPFIATGLDDEQFTALKKCRIMPVECGMLIFHSSGHCAVADRNAALSLHRNAGRGGLLVIDEPYEDPSVLMILQKRKKNTAYLDNCIKTALHAYHACGVTAIQDNTWDPDIFRFFNKVIKDMDVECWSKELSELTLHDPDLSPDKGCCIRQGPAKFFIDGAFFNRTAWLTEPYAGSTDCYGSGTPSEQIIRRIEPAVAERRQCAFHAAGDRAVSELCDALEILEENYPWIPDLRIRIEHAQLIAERDYSRIRRLGLVVSAQPEACGNPARDIELLGEERARRAYPHKKILTEGIPLAFGSDFPYEDDYDPWKGISSTCSRQSGEPLKLHEAVKAYTEGSAYAGFSEKRKGRIAPGYKADFLLIPEIESLRYESGRMNPESVFFAGGCVYSASG